MASSNLGIQAQGSLLEESLKSQGVGFKAFWLLNRNKDSVTLLRDFLACMNDAVVYPVLNLYFGKEEEFVFYRNSHDLHEIIAQRGGQQLTFPNLYDLTADKLYTDEIAFEELHKYLKQGARTSLERWLNSVRKTLDDVYAPLINAAE